MGSNILDIVKYANENFSLIMNVAIVVLISAYFFYGFLLAVDASKRYRNSWTPVLVFICWLVLSVLFVPIYLIIRPDYGAADRVEASKTDIALLMSSGLYLCDGCDSVVEKDHKYCLNCGRSLLLKCLNCEHKVVRSWKMCPECGLALNDPKETKSVFGKNGKNDVQTTDQSVVTIVPTIEKPPSIEVPSIQPGTKPSEEFIPQPSEQPVVESTAKDNQSESQNIAIAEKLNTAQEI